MANRMNDKQQFDQDAKAPQANSKRSQAVDTNVSADRNLSNDSRRSSDQSNDRDANIGGRSAGGKAGTGGVSTNDMPSKTSSKRDRDL